VTPSVEQTAEHLAALKAQPRVERLAVQKAAHWGQQWVCWTVECWAGSMVG
jgi:hypothetical protein